MASDGCTIRTHRLIFGALVLMVPAMASAQASLQTLRLAPDVSGFVTLSRGEVLPHGVVAGSLGLDVAAQPLALSAPSLSLPRQSIVHARISAQLSVAVGLWGWLELRGWAGAVGYQRGLDSAFTRRTVGFSDLGSPRFEDVRLGARFWAVRGHGATPMVSLGATVGLPTGAEGSLAGEPDPTFTPEAFASWVLGVHGLALRLSYTVRSTPAALGATQLGDVMALGAGFHYGIDGAYDRRRSVVMELEGALLGRDSRAPDGNASLVATLGYRYRLVGGKLPYAVLVGASGAPLRTPGVPIARGFVSFEAASSDPDDDYDSDGIPDRRDLCARTGEDLDDYEDDDGCPEYDNDGDGVPDEDDECPLVADDLGSTADDDGCPTVRPVDQDGDAIPDNEDKCPTQAEDRDFFEDWDGCLERDNDADGLYDLGDLCPLAPEDKNGFQDDDGCPDGGRAPFFVLYRRGALILTRAITFSEGSVELPKASLRVLEQLGAVMRSTPEIARVSILVYPEKGGKAARELAKQRAQKLASELDKLGIGSGRGQVSAARWNRRYAGSVVVSASARRGGRR